MPFGVKDPHHTMVDRRFIGHTYDERDISLAHIPRRGEGQGLVREI